MSLAESDITVLLPSDEQAFELGQEPKSRAALDGTITALHRPELTVDPGRSLFATLMQVHHLWGKIARQAVMENKSLQPWDENSSYAQMETRLRDWEAKLPDTHRWSLLLLPGYKESGQDLAYLAVTMVTRLCNIVIRKAYLTK